MLTLLAALAACGDKPGGPSQAPPPAVTTYTLTGTVTSAGQPLSGARVEVTAGANAGRSTTTNAAGQYTLSNLSAGALTLRASAAGYASQTLSISLGGNATTDFSLTAGAFQTNGRVIDAVTGAGLAGVSITGDGFSGGSDASGMFNVAGSGDSTDPRSVLFAGGGIVQRQTHLRVPGPDAVVSLMSGAFDLTAFDQMARSPSLRRWTEAPPLLVETRALQFTSVNQASGVGVADAMSESEADGLIADLFWALPQLSGGAFAGFAGVTRQASADGATVPLLNSGTITVARLVGLTAATGFWGYSRWQFRSDGTVVSGIVMLDRDFERSGSPFLRSLRTHELGHALGYNHVTSRSSFMNSAARLEPTSLDLEACRVVFQRRPGNRSPDVDPDDASLNRLGSQLTWSPPIR